MKRHLTPVLFLFLVFSSCNSNERNNSSVTSNNIEVATDSLINAAAVEAAQQAVHRDSIDPSNYDMLPPDNFLLTKNFELDWRDGEVVVPEGKFWVITTLLNFSDDHNIQKAVAKNLCVREPEEIEIQDAYQPRKKIKYIAICVGGRDFFKDGLNMQYKDGSQYMMKRFWIRRFAMPPGTTVCVPSQENGNMPSFISYEVMEYSDSTNISKDNLLKPETKADPNDTNCYL